MSLPTQEQLDKLVGKNINSISEQSLFGLKNWRLVYINGIMTADYIPDRVTIIHGVKGDILRIYLG